jgi:hypothetical protein
MDSLTKGWNKYVAERHVQQEIITLRKRVEELQKKNKRFLDLYQDYERSYKRAEAELARLCEGNAALLDAGVRQMQRAEKAEARVNELEKENKQLFDYTLTQGQAVQVFYEQGEQAKKRVAELEMCIKDGINQNTNQAAMALNYNAINRAEKAEAERDGFRNGQVQVQAMLDEVMDSNKKLAQDLATMKEAVTDLVSMFAYRLDDPPRISTGGLSVLEDAFEILGYDDPHPVPERQCQFEGCTKTATSGTPTKNGYMRVCLKHFEEINLNPKEVTK